MATADFGSRRTTAPNEALPLEVKIEVPNAVILFDDGSAGQLTVSGDQDHCPRFGYPEPDGIDWTLCGSQLRPRQQTVYMPEEMVVPLPQPTAAKCRRWASSKRRSSESGDRQRVVDRERKRRRRENETPEAAEQRRARDRERKRRSRQNETPERAAVRRAVAREKKRLMLKNESPEEAERRRAVDRENKRIVRQRATAEKREHRLAVDRGRKRLSRQNRSRLVGRFEDHSSLDEGHLWQNIPGASL